MRKKENGVTLVALVVTIIILLIISGIAVSATVNKRGTINETKEAISEAQKQSIIEKIEADLYNIQVKTGKLPSKDELKEIISNNYGTIDKEGENELNSFTPKGEEYQIEFIDIEGWKRTITDYVKVGDYVDYEPTKTDVSKTQNVNINKLTYTSPIGGYSTYEGTITHGNGNKTVEESFVQTFMTKSNNELKWRVLSVSDEKIELVSDSVVKTDAGKNFIFEGGIGYLYAEQELNEICKIYGYGYGADISVGATYKIGGPEDNQKNKKIQGTGARSITVDDINKLAGIYEENGIMKKRDGSKLTYVEGDIRIFEYGNETNLTTGVYYPVLNSSNTKYPGQSTDTKKGTRNTYYHYRKEQILSDNGINMLFNGNYWLASRCINTYEDSIEYDLRAVDTNYVIAYSLALGTNSNLRQDIRSSFGVRPVVTIKSDVIDLDTNYKTEGTWKLK